MRWTLTIKMNEKWIQKCEFFKDKPPDIVASISMHLKAQNFSKNENVYVEGDPSTEIYFILKGHICFLTKFKGKHISYYI